MNGICLWNPWSVLLCHGEKRIETRGWATNIRGWVAIIATKTGLPSSELAELCRREPFKSSLAKIGYRSIADFPTGIVGAVRLGPCVRLISRPRSARFAGGEIMLPPPEPERSFGDYTAGRYAWITLDRIVLPKPVPWKGGQRFVTIPDNVVWNAYGKRPE